METPLIPGVARDRSSVCYGPPWSSSQYPIMRKIPSEPPKFILQTNKPKQHREHILLGITFGHLTTHDSKVSVGNGS